MPRSTALHISYMVSKATCVALRASISTPVCPVVFTVAWQRIRLFSGWHRRRFLLGEMGSGWHKGGLVGGFFTGHNASDTGYRQYITFFMLVIGDQA